MKSADIIIQLITADFEPFGYVRPFLLGGSRHSVPAAIQLLENRFSVCLAGMKLHYCIAQTVCREAAVNDIKCCRFFGDKQNGFSGSKALRDNICDGLALTGSGRADQHKIETVLCGENG